MTFMKIQSVYLLGSRSEGLYTNTIEFVTNGSITHVSLLFFVGNSKNDEPPLDISTAARDQWVIDNSINTTGSTTINGIYEFPTETITLTYGHYVFDTNSSIIQTSSNAIIKSPGQSSGAVITPYSIYLEKYDENIIIKLITNRQNLKSLIKMYWGKAYGIDSVFANAVSRTTMICTHLCNKYINQTYTLKLNGISPTGLILYMKNSVGSPEISDTFMRRKVLKYHIAMSVLPAVGVAIIMFVVLVSINSFKTVQKKDPVLF